MDAAAAGASNARAIASGGSDRTTGDGEVFAGDAVAAVFAAAALGRQAVIFAAGDGEAAAAGDAVAAVGVAVTTGEMVVALQGQRHVAFRSEGGTGVGLGLDVHVVQRDFDLMVLGVDGHGVGRSGVLVTICDDGVGVHHILIRAL